MLRKLIEYRVTHSDGDIDHVNWREARKLQEKPPEDIELLERVTRYWQEDEELVDEEAEVLYEKNL